MGKDRQNEVSAITITDIPDKIWLEVADIVMPFCRNHMEVRLCHTLADELWKEALMHANEQLIVQSLEVHGATIELKAIKHGGDVFVATKVEMQKEEPASHPKRSKE